MKDEIAAFCGIIALAGFALMTFMESGIPELLLTFPGIIAVGILDHFWLEGRELDRGQYLTFSITLNLLLLAVIFLYVDRRQQGDEAFTTFSAYVGVLFASALVALFLTFGFHVEFFRELLASLDGPSH